MTLNIVIVNWNTADVTCKCINSILKHTSKVNYCITVVDNSSTDNSIKKISTIKNSRLKLIKNTSNLGYAKACNIGANSTKSNYVLFLNSDILFFDNSIKTLLDFLHKHTKNIGLVSPQFLNPDKSIQASVFPPQTLFNAFKQYILNIPNSFSKYTPKTNKPTEVWSVSGGAVLIKNSVFKKCGGWDESYHFYFEDLQLCKDIRHMGLKIYYLPQAKLIHYHGLSGQKLSSDDQQWKRLVPGSIKFHGPVKHYLLSTVLYLGQKKLMLSVFLLFLILRLFLSQFYNDLNNDLLVHLDWSRSLYQNGFKNFFFKSDWLTTPPTQPSLINFLFYLSSYIYQHRYILSQLHNLIKIPPSFLIIWFDKYGPFISLKLWSIFADLASAAFLYYVLSKNKNTRRSMLPVILFLSSPILLFESSIWGQNDVLSSLLATISLFILPQNYLISSVFFLFSLLLKPTTIIIFPLFLFAFFKYHTCLKKILRTGLITFSIFIASFIPFCRVNNSIFPEIKDIFINRIAPSSKGISLASVSAFNFYSSFYTIDKTTGATKIAFLTIDQISILVFIFINILVIKQLLSITQYHTSIFRYIYIISQTSFIFMTSMLERYFLVGFISSNIVLFSTKNKSTKLALIFQYFIHFLNLFYAFFYRHIDIIKIIFQSNNYLLIRLLSFANTLLTLFIVKSLLNEKSKA